eukprot:TRINITY_DN13989_c0_g1_i2.p1 TRINITY_DN13989_c0_g1~~TRINITY_DN13989_c0_g1_i2.p1  ORF type:complete len:302 (+),score=33.15 TRINITY_DN13989_c0_g1_i2:62-967(+)
MEQLVLNILGALALTIYLVQVASVACHFSKAWISELYSSFSKSRWSRTFERSPLDVEIDQEIDRRRVQLLTVVLRGMKHTLGATVAYMLYKQVLGEDLLFSEAQVRLCVVMFFLLVCACSSPWCVKKCTVHVCVVAVMVFLGAMVSTFRETFSATALWSCSLTTLVLRMSLSLCYGNFGLSVILNSAYAICSLFFVRNAKGVCYFADAIPLPIMIFCETVILFFLVFASDVAERYCRLQILATRLQGEGAASTRLLDLMCDVMVELDSDRCLSAHSEKLAALVALDEPIVRNRASRGSLRR